jgi:hypothetical protein
MKITEQHYHEALDRSYCVSGIIQNMLLEHPAIKKDKKIRKKIEKAQKLILDTYQEFGSKLIKKDN